MGRASGGDHSTARAAAATPLQAAAAVIVGEPVAVLGFARAGRLVRTTIALENSTRIRA
jgi:hypothetical protein